MTFSAFARVCQAETQRQLRLSWSYRFEMLGEIVLWLVAFPVMMLIFASVAINYDKVAQTATLLCFVVWDLCFGVIVTTVQGMTQESRQGTLEPIFLSPIEPLLLVSVRTSAAFVVRMVRSSLLALLLALVLSLPIQISGEAWLVIGVMITSAYGLTLLLGGITLIHKEVGSIIGIVSLLATLATGVLVPLNSLGIYFDLMKLFVPFAWGMDTLRTVIMDSSFGYSSIGISTWAALFVQSALLITLGVLIFKQSYQRARVDNLLGSY